MKWPAQSCEVSLDPLETFRDRHKLREARTHNFIPGFRGNARGILKDSSYKAVSARREIRYGTHKELPSSAAWMSAAGWGRLLYLQRPRQVFAECTVTLEMPFTAHGVTLARAALRIKQHPCTPTRRACAFAGVVLYQSTGNVVG